MKDSIGKLEAELNERRDAFHQLNVELEKANIEVENLENENKVLKKKFEVKSDNFKSEKATAEKNMNLNTWEILPYMAVFESVHRTADVGSSMDTFLCG